MPKVTIIQRIVPHYRLPFFAGLHKRLAADGIELHLVYGQEYPGTVPRSVDFSEPWVSRIENQYLGAGQLRLVWQPCLSLLQETDLVIFEQANAMLTNHWLMLRRALRPSPAVAFWGHGSNRQAENPDSFSEKLKRLLIKRVDWWFAYTELSAGQVRRAGFPPERITVVNNAVDTTSLRQQLAAVDEVQLAAARERLGLRPADKVCVYCGGLYANKRLDFLMQAGNAIHARIPEFRLLVIGDGPDRGLIEAQAAQPWLRYLGELTGADRAVFLRLGLAVLMPGLVGLVIIDSFAAGLPLFTLEDSPHSPEIEYLRTGENGFITAGSLEAYNAAVTSFLTDEDKQARVRAACLDSSLDLTLENMVERYANGITQCLASRFDNTPSFNRPGPG